MSTTFEHVNRYPGTADEVHAMLTSREFRERVCTYIRSIAHSVEVTTSGSETTVRVTQTQVPRKIPSIAAKFVGDTVEIVQHEVWTGQQSATFGMEIPGKPGHLRGTIELRSGGAGVEQVFSGLLKVNIPMVGGRLEGFIGDLLAKALAAEGRVGTEWMAGRRA